MKFPLASTCNSPSFVGVEKSHVDAGVNGFSPPPAMVMKSLASKIGIPRVFKRKVTEDLTFAPILITRPSLVVMVSDVSPLSTLTQPSFGMPAIAAISSTFFSIPDVSLGIRELGSVVVVVVVVVGATVVVVVGAIVLIGAIAMVVVVGTTVVVVGAIVVEVVVVVGAMVVEVVVVVGATVVVVGATVVEVVGATVVEVVEVVVVVGIVVSIISVSAELCSESLPALSVTTAVTDHVPSVRVANSHVVATAVS